MKVTFILAIGLCSSACNSMTSDRSESTPEMMQPDWTGIGIERLPVKFGQIIKINTDSVGLSAVVLDFDHDEGGHWIGVCFIDQNRLFGRQIPSGMINTKCLDLLDLTYIQIDALTDYEVLETIEVDRTQVGIGSISPVTNVSEILWDFEWGMEQRGKEQTPCDKGLLDLNPVRECFFDIEKIKN